CMDWLARGLTGVANAGAFALVARLAPAPTHTCECSFEAPTADEKVLAVLQSQLDNYTTVLAFGLLYFIVGMPTGDSWSRSDFFEYDSGFHWHHRALLKPTPVPGRWIICTPDLSVQVASLDAHRIIALERESAIPAQRARAAYVFDPLQPAELEQMRARAVALLDILGITSAGPALPFQAAWRVADPACAGFDEGLPTAITADRDSFMQSLDGALGMALIDDEWVAVASATPDSHDDWLRQNRAGGGRGSRLVGGARVNGTRFMPMVDVVSTSSIESVPGCEWMTRQLDFASKSGIGRQSGFARARRRISEVMTHVQCFGQLNFYNLASAEPLTRYIHQIESAVRKSPKNSDASGVDMLLSSEIDENGGIIATKYQRWVSPAQRDQAQTMKQDEAAADTGKAAAAVAAEARGRTAPPAAAAASPRLGADRGESPPSTDIALAQAYLDLIKSKARKLLCHERQTIYRAAADVDLLVDAGEIAQIRPCCGVSLRFSSAKRRDFIRATHRLGLVSFRHSIAHSVGCFFAARKNGDIRLAVDGRDGVDLKDGFYQFADQDLAPNSGFDVPEKANWHGCPRARDETSQSFEPVSGDSRVCLVLRAAHGPIPELAHLPAGRPQLALAFDRPLVAPYVDSGTLIGLAPAANGTGLAAALDTISGRHLANHEVAEPTNVAESTVGRGVAAGQAMKRVAGHVVNHFMLARCALAALDHVYSFIMDFGPRTGRFSAALTSELRTIKGLVFLCQADLGAPWSRIASASDSSMLGYALHLAAVEPDEVVRAARNKERWRFSEADFSRGHGAMTPRTSSSPPTGGAEFSASDAAIHEKESGVQLLGPRFAGRGPSFYGGKVLSMGGNMGAALIFEKGRAKSRALRQLSSDARGSAGYEHLSREARSNRSAIRYPRDLQQPLRVASLSRPPGSPPEWAAAARQRGAGRRPRPAIAKLRRQAVGDGPRPAGCHRAQPAPPATLTRYQDAYEKLLGFASEHGLSIQAGAAVDSSLKIYVDHLRFDGRGIYDARVAARGTARVRRSNLKGPTALQLARAAQRGWQKRAGNVSRAPMPQQAWFLACDRLCDTGNKADLSAAQALAGRDQAAGLPAKLKAAKRGSSAPLFGLTSAEHERRCKAAFEACSLWRLPPHAAN
ncbi:unnamed protein product, partial [Prorocentrum cordatum]